MDYILRDGELIETDPLWVVAGFESEEEFNTYCERRREE